LNESRTIHGRFARKANKNLGIGLVVLGLVSAALVWPLIATSSWFTQEQLTINDLKRLKVGDTAEVSGVVTFIDPLKQAFYFQDEDAGIRVEHVGQMPEVGRRTTVRAKIATPYDEGVGLRSVRLTDSEVRSHAGAEVLDSPEIALADLLRGNAQREGRRLRTSGVVRFAQLSADRLTLELGDAGQRMTVTVLNASGVKPESLIDLRVSVVGTLQLDLDRIAETFAPHLWVNTPRDLRRMAETASTPTHALSGWTLLREPKFVEKGYRVRVHGRVVRADDADTLLIDSNGLLIPIESPDAVHFKQGDAVVAAGWPTRQRWNVVLERATVLSQPLPAASSPQLSEPLRRIAEIRALSGEIAAQNRPIDVEAVITSVHYVHQFLFVQTEGSAIFVDAWGQSLKHLEPGVRVRIRGVSAPGEFAPVIVQPRIDRLGTTALPTAEEVNPEVAPSGKYDSKWVVLEGVVRPFAKGIGSAEFNLQTSLGSVVGTMIMPPAFEELQQYVDTKVRVRGVMGTTFTSKGVLTGYRLFVHSPVHMQVLQRLTDASALKVRRRIDELLRFRGEANASQRVMVQGVVTLRVPNRLYIQDESGSLQVLAPSATSVRVGDVVEAVGYPTPSRQGPVLEDAVIRPLEQRGEIAPNEVVAEQILNGSYDNTLVSVEARVVSQGGGLAQQSLMLQSGYNLFNAVLEGSVPLRTLREGSIVRVQGVALVTRRPRTERFRGDFNAVPDSFRILLRAPSDVQVIKAAPLWNLRHAWPVIGFLMMLICMAMLWARTLRQRVEQQTSLIEEQSAFLRQVIDMCPDRISVKDNEGRYTLINQALGQELGQSAEEIVGKRDRDLDLDPSQVQSTEQEDRDVLESRSEMRIPEQMRTDRSGQPMWFYTVKRPMLDESGRATHLLQVSNDITAHKQAEQTLQRAREAAEAANRAKSEFLANMSHEIRTPLNGIIGMSELCLDTDLSSEQREYVQALKLSGDSLLGVINDILDFSKIEAGKLELESRRFEIREMLGTVLKTLALQAHSKGLELLCDIASDVPQVVQGDSTRLRQILLNLIGDAIRATAKGEVCVRIAVESEDDLHSVLRFAVTDTSGRELPAVSPTVLDNEDSLHTGQFSSADLGLTISSRLVGLMQGRLWHEPDASGRNQLCFTVSVGAVSATRSRHRRGSLTLHGTRVLIVDDNEAHRQLLQHMLNAVGTRTLCAASASEGLELLHQYAKDDPFELALIDADMPVTSGFVLAEQIATRKIPVSVVMMLDTSAQRHASQRCRDLNVDAQLLKPIMSEELLDTVDRVVQARESSTAQSRKVIQHQASLNVLVAEDNMVNQLVMQRLLTKRQHKVTIASSGKAALQALESEQFDLILMDVQMPELDGLEATREIRRREAAGTRTPIVALTAHALTGDRERCLEAGMDGYMTKPVNPTELDEVLEKYASSSRAGIAAFDVR
jgi:PAS domain S-box-containing protein